MVSFCRAESRSLTEKVYVMCQNDGDTQTMNDYSLTTEEVILDSDNMNCSVQRQSGTHTTLGAKIVFLVHFVRKTTTSTAAIAGLAYELAGMN